MSKNFGKGEVIFREGDSSDSFYEVNSGIVGIYTNYGESNEQKLTDIKPGHIFGEMALVDAFPRSATAVALEDTVVTEVTVAEVQEYFKSSPDKINFILSELAGRLTRLTDEYNEACETVKGLYPQDTERKETIADKIRKFAASYEMLSKAKQPSAEFLRETGQTGHKDGFAKKVEKYKKGTVIFREGEPARCMYDIHFGAVGIYQGYGTPEEKLLTTLYADKFFGEIGLVGGEARTATAVVIEDDTIVESIYSNDFAELFEKNPTKIEMIIRHLSFRIRRMTNEYTEATKLIYEAAQAELSKTVTEELKNKARTYTGKLFD